MISLPVDAIAVCAVVDILLIRRAFFDVTGQHRVVGSPGGNIGAIVVWRIAIRRLNLSGILCKQAAVGRAAGQNRQQ